MEKIRVQRNHQVRLLQLATLMILGLLVLVGGLFYLQILRHETYLHAAEDQQQLKVDIAADRGRILDRRGIPLAVSKDRYTFYVDIPKGFDADKAAASLAPVLGRDYRSLRRALRQPRGRVLVERKMTRQNKEQVEALRIPGTWFDVEKERYYPFHSLAAQVIGWAGMDNAGLEGIEGLYDEYLEGVKGAAILQVDGHEELRINPDFPTVPPKSGHDVILTLDSQLQEAAENVLDRAVERCGAKNGAVVVVDPNRGEILALACYPRIDLNTIGKVRNRSKVCAAMRNRIITDLFEPGSTFKIVTLAGILERGLANLDEQIFCENGQYLVRNHRFHDIHRYGWLKVREVVELSSNIGVIKLAERMEDEGLYQMARKYGFGSRTGVDFPGEGSGILRRLDQWSGLSLASIAIGQEICVTPLQMVMAYAAIANGGYLMKPMLVKEIRDPEGEAVFQARPEIIREVMSRETADRIRDVLVDVVEHGTGTKARIEGFQMAGKTGTAQKSLPGHRGYLPGKYMTSFGGFFPADDPRYAIFIVLDEPERDRWGGESAAPLCRELIESTIYAYDGLLEKAAPDELVHDLPSGEGRYRVLRLAEAEEKETGEDDGDEVAVSVFDLTYLGNGASGSESKAYPFIPVVSVRGPMPDVSGLSLREACTILSSNGLRVRVEGMGKVLRQEPVAGAQYATDKLCTLWGEGF